MRCAPHILVCVIASGCAPAPVIPMDDPSAGESGGGVELDPARLDRSVAAGACGYPAAGPAGYGTGVGQRFADDGRFELIDCDGRRFTLADLLCERAAGGHNAGVLINLGAGWCGPCQDETLELPGLYDAYRGRGIEIVQVMFQDWEAKAPTKAFCSDWSAGTWRTGVGGSTEDVGVELGFPVVLDQVGDFTAVYLQDPQSATPVNILIDANANIRWKIEGQQPSIELLQAQLDLVLGNPYGS